MNRDVNISFSSGKKGSKRDLVRWISEGGEHEEQNASMILDKRYRPVHHLGTGTYGTVWRAVDSDSGEFVAIKKCQCVFASRALARRTLREIRILRLLGGKHSNLINLIALLPPEHDFNDVYLVMPPMETDLASIVRSDQELSDQVRLFTTKNVPSWCFYFTASPLSPPAPPAPALLLAAAAVRPAFLARPRRRPPRHQAEKRPRQRQLPRAARGLRLGTHDRHPHAQVRGPSTRISTPRAVIAPTHLPNRSRKTVPMTDYVTTRWYRAPELLVGWAGASRFPGLMYFHGAPVLTSLCRRRCVSSVRPRRGRVEPGADGGGAAHPPPRAAGGRRRPPGASPHVRLSCVHMYAR